MKTGYLAGFYLRIAVPDVWLLLMLAVSAGYAQINQDHPELCGKRVGMVALPRSIAATESLASMSRAAE